MNRLIAAVCAALLATVAATANAAPTVTANVNVDLDHGLAFPQNKQNEPSIARDPQTGALIAGANDEISLDLCKGTTAPLTSSTVLRTLWPRFFFIRFCAACS